MTPVVAQKAAALGCSFAKSEPALGTCSRRGVCETLPKYLTSKITFEPDKIWLVVWNTLFLFPYIGNNDPNPNWLSYFSEGLKPPKPTNYGRGIFQPCH